MVHARGRHSQPEISARTMISFKCCHKVSSFKFKLERESLTRDVDLENEKSCPNRNNYKVRAFTRAIEVIGALEEPVRDVAQVKKVRTIRFQPCESSTQCLELHVVERGRCWNQQQDRRVLVG